MSKLKIVFSSLSAFFIILAFQNTVGAEENHLTNSNGIKITEEQYQNLKELGFSELAISQMDQEVFDENKDLKVDSQSETTKYYEIKEIESTQNSRLSTKSSTNTDTENTEYISTELTEEEYFRRVRASESNIQPFAASNTDKTSYRRLTTSIQKIGSDRRLYNKFIWDKLPSTRSYDVLTISIDSMFSPIVGTQYGQQLWSYTHPVHGGFYGDNSKYSSSSSTWSKQGAGYGVRMNLKNNTTTLRVTELEGYMYYKIKRNSSIVPKLINAYGNYSHAKKSLSNSFSYSLSFGGPSIGWSGVSSTSFDQLTTHAQTNY